MRKRLFIIFISLITIFSLVHGSVPLVREGVRWRYFTRFGSGRYDIKEHWLYFKGTDTIDGKIYNVCYKQYVDSVSSTAQRYALLRQDGDKVYLCRETLRDLFEYPIYNTHSLDSCDCAGKNSYEVLIYDFTLNAGDTWCMLSGHPEDMRFNNGGRTNLKKVDSVSNIQLQGEVVKKQLIRNGGNFYDLWPTVVIEGIGAVLDFKYGDTSKEFTFPYVGIEFSAMYNLTWREAFLLSLEDEDGNVIWDEDMGMQVVETQESQLTYSDRAISIKSVGDWHVELYRFDGQLAMTRHGIGNDDISLETLSKGIYIAHLKTYNTIKTLKFAH